MSCEQLLYLIRLYVLFQGSTKKKKRMKRKKIKVLIRRLTSSFIRCICGEVRKLISSFIRCIRGEAMRKLISSFIRRICSEAMRKLISSFMRSICDESEEEVRSSAPMLQTSLAISSLDLSCPTSVSLADWEYSCSNSRTTNDDASKESLQSLPISPSNLDFCINLTSNGALDPSLDWCSESSSNSALYSFRVVDLNLCVDEIWKKHYCSHHKILLVGEGDFSFSASLAVAFGSAPNMVATSLDSIGFLDKNYKRARANIGELKSRGSTVIHDVDATVMTNNYLLKDMKYFDRIIFNFPYAGFFKTESEESQKCRHQTLVCLFLKNAKELVADKGEIHITHKSNGFHRRWNLESLASSVGLRLISEVPFNFIDYPGYRTKCGFGGDGNFRCHPCNTYKFGF